MEIEKNVGTIKKPQYGKISIGAGRERKNMFGYIEGYSDTDNIHYCPACGAEVGEFHADGTATCTD